jgi:hypothetical protein
VVQGGTSYGDIEGYLIPNVHDSFAKKGDYGAWVVTEERMETFVTGVRSKWKTDLLFSFQFTQF